MELHGLFRALRAVRIYVYGVKSFVVEVDAKYIKGMLNNPDVTPNAVINRWIAGILLFNPRLVHVPATKHTGADGLSRRTPAPDDDPEPDDAEEWLDDALGFTFQLRNARIPVYDHVFLPSPTLNSLLQQGMGFGRALGSKISPLQYQQATVLHADVLATLRSRKQTGTSESKAPRGRAEKPRNGRRAQDSEHEETDPRADSDHDMEHQLEQGSEISSPQEESSADEEDGDTGENSTISGDNIELPRGRKGKKHDAELPQIRDFIDKGMRDPDLSREQINSLVRKCSQYFVYQGVLYRRNEEGRHKVVLIDNAKRLKAMKDAHDDLGHKGYYPVRARVRERFFWHDMDENIRWYLKTCHQCQLRRVGESRIPQRVPFVPGLFVKIHLDVVYMSVESEGKKYLVHARCALSSFPEWRALAKLSKTALGKFIFEELICRYGALSEIVSDNGPEIRDACDWLEEAYHIKHIRVSAYNSRANGLIERAHFSVRESLMKACAGQPQKWVSKCPYVFWAERITTRKHLGMSPYQMAYGCDPVMPFDFEEATWLVPPLQPPMTTEEMIILRARQLEKRPSDIAAMRERVRKFRQQSADRMLKNYKGLKAPERVKPGTLVLVKNKRIEMELNRKHKNRWLGPYIVLRQHGGTFQGSYILAELDTSVIVDRVAAARIRLYWPRVETRYNVSRIIEEAPKYVWERATGPQSVDDEEVDSEDEDATSGLPVSAPADDSGDEDSD